MRSLVKFARLSLFFFVSVNATPNIEQVSAFTNDLQHYYCESGWICKAFENMSATTFVAAWQELAQFFADPALRWQYACDNEHEYSAKKQCTYRTLSRYNNESSDIAWINECRAYHTFLTTHIVDASNDKLVRKQELDKSELTPQRYVSAQDFVAQYDAQSFIDFYQFFFQQLVNVVLNKLDYMADNDDVAQKESYTLIKDAQELDTVYATCCHKVRPPEKLARDMAFHYERIQSVIQVTIETVMQRVLSQCEGV